MWTMRERDESRIMPSFVGKATQVTVYRPGENLKMILFLFLVLFCLVFYPFWGVDKGTCWK